MIIYLITVSVLYLFIMGHASVRTDMRLREAEKTRFLETVEAARKDSISINGFYHISAWRSEWRDVVKDQLYLMAGKRSALGDWHSASATLNAPPDSDRGFSSSIWASLLDVVDRLYINVASPSSETLHTVKTLVLEEMKGTFTPSQLSKFIFSYNTTIERGTYSRKATPSEREEYASRRDLSEGESSTLARIHHHCREQRRARKRSLVFYIHDKGGCCYPNLKRGKQGSDFVGSAVAAWRDVMNAAVLEFPSICLRALLGGHTTCGYGTQGRKAHYSGNFWWADCGHVAALPPQSTLLDAWKAEFWILRTAKSHDTRLDIMHTCAYEVHHCSGNHYAEACKRTDYYRRILALVNQTTLPPLSSGTSDLEYMANLHGKKVNIVQDFDMEARKAATAWSPNSHILTDRCRPLYENGTKHYMDQKFWGTPFV